MKQYLLIFVCLFIGIGIAKSQENIKQNVSIMFYNVENLFDTKDDPHTNDNDFLPSSKRHWTNDKLEKKLKNIGKVIYSTGIEPPMIIGIAEIENEKVINQLITQTGLMKFHYKIIHKDSPDPRGIDVIMIYRSDLCSLIKYNYINVSNIGNNDLRTRDILYSIIKTNNNDTLHIFFNHWPSRIGGIKSEQKRIYVAKILRTKIDSVIHKNIRAKIIIMGDFNDEPDNISIIKYLNTIDDYKKLQWNQLINLSYEWLKDVSWKGTYKYKGKWSIFDQIIVSKAFFDDSNKKTKIKSAKIHFPSFILIKDTRNTGYAPFQTYNGINYLGGYSDHIPILLLLELN